MKNSVKTLLFALCASLGVLSSVRAADAPPAPPADLPPGPPDQPEHFRHHDGERGERMAKELGLTADQQVKMKDLFKQQHDAMKAIHDDTTLTKEQKQAKSREIRKNFEDQRRALMTPEQQKKADELREKMKERRAHHDDAPPAPTPAPVPAT